MKKVLVVLVMMGMLVCGCGANSGTDTENTGTGNSSKTSSITEEDLNEVWDSAKEYYEGIEPLEEEVKSSPSMLCTACFYFPVCSYFKLQH